MNNVIIKGSHIGIPKFRNIKKRTHLKYSRAGLGSKPEPSPMMRAKKNLEAFQGMNLPQQSRFRLCSRNSATPVSISKRYCTPKSEQKELTLHPKVFKTKKRNVRYHYMLQGFFKKLHINDKSRNLKKEGCTMKY
ncbi:unnamed protein product [Moneuplotes crassus]|uniref:Uncharacterized protein n=1 Tax=Euplotes crassus TaxID=5936 RepID=A0AAD1XS31_EUPCR|nr:unnamed protein product [Moneuplotes crassus]